MEYSFLTKDELNYFYDVYTKDAMKHSDKIKENLEFLKDPKLDFKTRLLHKYQMHNDRKELNKIKDEIKKIEDAALCRRVSLGR